MIELIAARPTHSAMAWALGAAVMATQVSYLIRQDPYEMDDPYEIVSQVRTYSRFMHSVGHSSAIDSIDVDQFASQVAELYYSFAQRQERLGAEFEAAIFSDLESLYEA